MLMNEKELMEWRGKKDLPEVRMKIEDFKVEMGRDGVWMKIHALAEQYDDLEDEISFRYLRWKWAAEAEKKESTLALIQKPIEGMELRLESLRRRIAGELKNLFHPDRQKDSITIEMIERARQSPIENMIEVNRKIARCISGSHADLHPSMSVKGNYCKCFSCGWHGDAISVAILIHGWNFREAVKNLQ